MDDEVLDMRLDQLDLGLKKVTDEMFGASGREGIRVIVLEIRTELKHQKEKREKNWQVIAGLLVAGIAGSIGVGGLFFLWVSKELAKLGGLG